MKKLILALAISVPTIGFAQGNTTSASQAELSPKKNLGLSVGAEYMNLSDMKFTFKPKRELRNYVGDETYSQGMHIGMAGVKIGYQKINNAGTGMAGFGFDLNLRFLQSINRSEIEGIKSLYFLIPEANLVYGPGALSIFVGANTTSISGSREFDDYRLAMGGQAGLGLKLNESLKIKAGYSVSRFFIEQTDFDADIAMSGFYSSLNYTF